MAYLDDGVVDGPLDEVYDILVLHVNFNIIIRSHIPQNNF
jgi:hypothetical protein